MGTKELTQKELFDVLSYDTNTGMLTWKEKDLSKFASRRAGKIWNTRFAGRLAGFVGNGGYLRVSINDRGYLGHQLVWLYLHGEFPSGHIDHINHDRGDNRACNLRVVSRHENSKNARLRKDNTTGHAGVYWNKRSKKWHVMIRHLKKLHHGGFFNDIKDAITKRKIMECNYGFHENHGSA